MACLQFESTNPKLSYIISKNPASGLFARQIREGNMFGWYSHERCYNIFFKDAPDKVSYKTHPNDEFEYNNLTRYTSSLFVLNALTDVLRSAFLKPTADDVEGEYTHTLTIPSIYVSNPNCLKCLEQQTDISIVVKHQMHNIYSLGFCTKKSVYTLLNFVGCFALLNAVYNDAEYINVNEDFLKKYLKCLDVVDLPYFARYIFKTKLMRSTTWFKAYQTILEKSAKNEIKMEYGFLSENRYYAVKNYLKDKPDSILDFGCGSGRYVDPLTKGRAIKYYAIDKDEDCIEKVKSRCRYENLETFTNLAELIKVYKEVDGSPPLSVIMVEVFEHLDYEEAKQIVKYLLSELNVNRMVITTPNKSFNKYYDNTNDELRIEEHQFELNTEEFMDIIRPQLLVGYTASFKGVGDSVNGEQPTQMAIIERSPA